MTATSNPQQEICEPRGKLALYLAKARTSDSEWNRSVPSNKFSKV